MSSNIQVYHGDCLEVIATLQAASIDACVTDPPYGLSFMNRKWDYDVPSIDVWKEVFRVLRPGAHLMAFGGTRTYHRMVCAIEDAGFEIRDQLAWLFGTGFPKSHNLPDGLGTALKPAHEPIVLARKPLSEDTVAANVLRHGAGALNISACRVPSGPDHAAKCASVVGLASNTDGACYGEYIRERTDSYNSAGRWPANVVHDGSQMVLDLFAEQSARMGMHCAGSISPKQGNPQTSGVWGSIGRGPNGARLGDTGTAARFYYSAKASKEDRAGSKHPTIKPISLIEWLVKMVTPPGGTVLDPFAGSGTLAAAAHRADCNAILIEREAEYVSDIQRRVTELIQHPATANFSHPIRSRPCRSTYQAGLTQSSTARLSL